ncbi:hypothetical protein M9H77_32756 [Catharanthus roseus]|uniref:Uncharacterized protein n=1 Tax=Catharanthus roseus TaxID=4058 RepID=A0ACC0A439_CATRO|nr:hypothetical protein M9H77_32756 [Catharanthus roseus]
MAAAKDQDIVGRLTDIIEDAPYGPWMQGLDINWILTVVFASPHLKYRTESWDYISKIGAYIAVPWLLIGDFNQVLSHEYKMGFGGTRLIPFGND